LNSQTARPNIVDWGHFDRNRNELGPGFIKILGYFREDGVKSIARIEEAMRSHDTTALVVPAHTLKGESRQLGAESLAMSSCPRWSSSAACSIRPWRHLTMRPTRS
jgi:HPt (histidine-containing phosphotransfer) domain-containing protein